MRKDYRRFRPMGISDILDETAELYKGNFLLLVGIAAVVYVPFFLLQGLLSTPQTVTDEADIARMLGLLLVYLLLFAVVEPIVTGALTYGISERYLGRETSIGACFRRMLKISVFLPFLGAVLLKYLIISVPLFMMVLLAVAVAAWSVGAGTAAIAIAVLFGIAIGLGGISLLLYLWVRLALVEPCFIVEMKGVSSALNRTWSLMQGNLLKGFAVLFIAWVVVTVITAMFTAPTSVLVAMPASGGPEPSHVVVVLHMILSTVISTLMMPIASIVTILLYYDVRIRKEGFDLELLAEELDAKTRQFGAPGAAGLPQEQLRPQQSAERMQPEEQAGQEGENPQ